MASRRTIHGPCGARLPEAARPAAEVLAPGLPKAPTVRGVRVLIVAPGRATRERLASVLLDDGARCLGTEAVEDLSELLEAHRFDVVLLSDQFSGSAGQHAQRLVQAARSAPSLVVVADEPTLDQALAALRAGMCDLIPARAPSHEIITRIAAAAAKGRATLGQARRVRRLKRLCKRLNAARREVVGQIESLCDDLAGAYERLSDQMTKVAISSEFNSLVRQELDIEGLLRTVLEYALSRLGPTNAAVFLPSSTGEHTLGAYVNYDVPKDAAEMLLDHLNTVIPHRFEDAPGAVHISSDEALRRALGEDAHWLEGRSLVVLPCIREGETLAIVAFFRDSVTPFTPSQLESCDIIADLFGKQIARVIHVHHRHLPSDEWGMPGDPAGR